jgi:hypothetical protein
MLNILTLPETLQQKVRTSGPSLSYDSVSKIARLEDVKEQGTLIEAALKGETVRGIREKTRGSRQRKPVGDGRVHRTERVQESLDGYTAIVSGPVSPESERRMRAVVEALLERLSQGLN